MQTCTQGLGCPSLAAHAVCLLPGPAACSSPAPQQILARPLRRNADLITAVGLMR
jgi:hypothetical protein